MVTKGTMNWSFGTVICRPEENVMTMSPVYAVLASYRAWRPMQAKGRTDGLCVRDTLEAAPDRHWGF